MQAVMMELLQIGKGPTDVCFLEFLENLLLSESINPIPAGNRKNTTTRYGIHFYYFFFLLFLFLFLKHLKFTREKKIACLTPFAMCIRVILSIHFFGANNTNNISL